MKFFVVILSLVFSAVSYGQNTRVYNNTSLRYNVSSAQGVAEIMASKNVVGHFGGNSGYEGCGSGNTREQAYNNCCYSRSGMITVDVGYAQSSSGKWYCCRRYR